MGNRSDALKSARRTADLPVETRGEYADFDTGFVERSALEIYEAAQKPEIVDLAHWAIDRRELLRSLEPIDVLHMIADQELQASPREDPLASERPSQPPYVYLSTEITKLSERHQRSRKAPSEYLDRLEAGAKKEKA